MFAACMLRISRPWQGLPSYLRILLGTVPRWDCVSAYLVHSLTTVQDIRIVYLALTMA
jgi:hypothetical protein